MLFHCSKTAPEVFADVLDMEYLLLSDTSSVTERNDTKDSENNCEFIFVYF